jgi:hypothetical protein
MTATWLGRTMLLALVATGAALALAAVAAADPPRHSSVQFVQEFDQATLCYGMVVHVRAVEDQSMQYFADGSFSAHVDEVETWSYGTSFVTTTSRWNGNGSYGVWQSQGVTQLWSADHKLLLTASGSNTWTLSNGTSNTPHWDPAPLWNRICEELRP